MIYLILLNDIDIYNFTDDTTAYACDVNLGLLLEKLEQNTDKCHLVSGPKYEYLCVEVKIKFGKAIMWNW